MSGPTNFLSRWSRLKREADPASHPPGADSPRSDGAVAPEAGANATPRPDSEHAVEAGHHVDLPSIDAITGDTDIRAFLRSQVPADLTRAALRRAWVSDPAIRDFIGIAENQWDFNDPHAIPGFSPLRATDRVPALLCRALGGAPLAETSLERSLPAEESLASLADRPFVDLDRTPQTPQERFPPPDAVSSKATDDGHGSDDVSNGEHADASSHS
jgi:hypothetical protein